MMEIVYPNLFPFLRKKPTMKFEIYKDEKNEWRWRLLAANNKSIAESGEGYKNKKDLLHAIHLVMGSEEAEVMEM